MADKTYKLMVPVEVTITVADEPVGDPGDGAMHPLDPRRMEGIYDCEDPDAMLRHLAYNAVANGKRCASGLDGWGDIYVATGVEGFDDWPRWKRMAYVEDNHPVRMAITDVDTSDVDYLDGPPPTTDEVQAARVQ